MKPDKKMFSGNNKGMGLIQVLMLSAMVGGLSLVISKVQGNLSDQIHVSKTRLKESYLENELTQYLTNEGICTSNFFGRDIGTPLLEISKPDGSPIVQVGEQYNDNTVVLDSLFIEDLGPISPGYKRGNLIVTYLSNRVGGQLDRRKSFTIPLSFKVSGAGSTIESCHSDANELLVEACTSKGGTWNGSFCSLSSCPTNQILTGFDDDGIAICRSMNCPPDTFYRGLDSNEQPICAAPMVGGSCPGNTVAVGIDSALRIVCAPRP